MNETPSSERASAYDEHIPFNESLVLAEINKGGISAADSADET